jgi:hypothetical protein
MIGFKPLTRLENERFYFFWYHQGLVLQKNEEKTFCEKKLFVKNKTDLCNKTVL